jgi:hypothetical protein
VKCLVLQLWALCYHRCHAQLATMCHMTSAHAAANPFQGFNRSRASCCGSAGLQSGVEMCRSCQHFLWYKHTLFCYNHTHPCCVLQAQLLAV